jgi:phosphatidylserine decarboxylase
LIDLVAVNPQAVNEHNLDVLSRNKRSVLYMDHTPSGKTIAFVAIGALLVGSIVWTVEVCHRIVSLEYISLTRFQENATVKRGDELGYFAYGGSTVVAIFPHDLITFDNDLLEHSVPAGSDGKGAIETLMKVGCSLGRWNKA